MCRREVLVALVAAGLPACGSCNPHAPPDDAPGVAPGCLGDPISEMGEATYYDADGTGSCSFDRLSGGLSGGQSGEVLVAAINAPDYDHAVWCGACLAVSGPHGEVTVRVVDACPGCKHGDLDLSRQAFAKLAPLSAGRVAIAWHEVACPVTGPLGYQVKARSNAQWTAIQIRNHRYAIEGLSARGPSGSYQPIARTDDNYFVAPGGLGAGPYALKVTDVHGQVLEDPMIALGIVGPQPGAAQLPLCR